MHSVRAVPATDLDAVAAGIGDRPFHAHLSEQVAENDGCLEAYGVTPTRLLADAGLVGPTTSLVHATHLTDDDVDPDRRRPRLRVLLPDHRARPG